MRHAESAPASKMLQTRQVLHITQGITKQKMMAARHTARPPNELAGISANRAEDTYSAEGLGVHNGKQI